MSKLYGIVNRAYHAAEHDIGKKPITFLKLSTGSSVEPQVSLYAQYDPPGYMEQFGVRVSENNTSHRYADSLSSFIHDPRRIELSVAVQPGFQQTDFLFSGASGWRGRVRQSKVFDSLPDGTFNAVYSGCSVDDKKPFSDLSDRIHDTVRSIARTAPEGFSYSVRIKGKSEGSRPENRTISVYQTTYPEGENSIYNLSTQFPVVGQILGTHDDTSTFNELDAFLGSFSIELLGMDFHESMLTFTDDKPEFSTVHEALEADPGWGGGFRNLWRYVMKTPCSYSRMDGGPIIASVDSRR